MRTYPAVDAADQTDLRPNFTALIYPAYLTVKEQGDKVAPELQLSTNTPPTFLVIAQDDPVRLSHTTSLPASRLSAEESMSACG